MRELDRRLEKAEVAACFQLMRRVFTEIRNEEKDTAIEIIESLKGILVLIDTGVIKTLPEHHEQVLQAVEKISPDCARRIKNQSG